MKRIIFLLLLVFSLSLTNCGESKNDSNKSGKKNNNQNLLKYSILKEDISDTPLKIQVTLKVLIEDNKIDEQKIKNLLNYLYEKTINRSGFKHQDHPTNIYIYAYTSKDKAESGKGQWIGMISKSFDETKPEISISKTQLKALYEVPEKKWGLTHEQRLEIWKKIILLERKAQKEADKKYPLDHPGITKSDMNNNVNLMRELNEKYKNALAKEYGVKKEIIDSIGIEGIKKGWLIPK